jgi:hypothetical protein
VSHISVQRDSRGGSGQQSTGAQFRPEDLAYSLEALPNPFGNSVTLQVGSARPWCSIALYDAAGRLVRQLPVDGPSSRWDGRNGKGQPVPAGIYFARLTAMPGSECVKMLKLE